MANLAAARKQTIALRARDLRVIPADSSDEKFQLLLLVLRGANPLLILATLTF
jgi:hypothetical protein